MRNRPALSPSRLQRFMPIRLVAWFALTGVLSACGGPPADTPAPGANNVQKNPASAAPATASVEARAFRELARPVERDAPAQVIARNEAKLSAELSAPIRELPFDVGQAVPAGAIVVRLDARDAELALAQAEARVDQARAKLALVDVQLASARALRDQNHVSSEALKARETERLGAVADVKSAEAARDTARRTVDKAVLRAPFAGVVKMRTAQLGELASPGTPLLTLVEHGVLEVSAAVPARDADGLRQVGSARFVSGRGEVSLKVLRISPVVQRESRTVEVRLRRADGNTPRGTADLAAGDDGRIVWPDPHPGIAPEWLVKRGDALGIFIIEAGKARFVPVPGAREGRAALPGLAADAQVVTEGRNALADGQAVTLRASR